MKELLPLGTTPSQETAAFEADENFYISIRNQCAAFKHQLERLHPIPENLKGQLAYGIQYSKGAYRYVTVSYDTSSSPASDFVQRVLSSLPSTWDDAARQELSLDR